MVAYCGHLECFDNSLLFPLATSGTRLSAKSNKMLETELEPEDGGYWRRNWSRRVKGTGDGTGTGAGGRRVLVDSCGQLQPLQMCQIVQKRANSIIL